MHIIQHGTPHHYHANPLVGGLFGGVITFVIMFIHLLKEMGDQIIAAAILATVTGVFGGVAGFLTNKTLNWANDRFFKMGSKKKKE